MLDLSQITADIQYVTLGLALIMGIYTAINLIKNQGNVYAREEAKNRVRHIFLAVALSFLLPYIVKLFMKSGGFCSP